MVTLAYHWIPDPLPLGQALSRVGGGGGGGGCSGEGTCPTLVWACVEFLDSNITWVDFFLVRYFFPRSYSPVTLAFPSH